ncbi:MAG: tetratricopeptide repeat protein, partial [Bacteroidota bacterium]
MLISLLSTQIGVTQSYQVVVDSLLQLLPAQTTSDARVDLLNEISYAYRRVAPEQTLVYGRLALALADSTGYLKGQSIAAKNIGIGQYLTSAPVDSILSYYYQSIEIAEQIDDYYTQAAVNNNIALVYLQILKNRSAIRHYLRGIEIFEQHIAEDTFLKALMYSNLAGAYNRLGQYERAIQGFEKATKIATAKNYRTIISLSGADYAEALIQLDSIEQAESRFAEALAMQESLGDLRSIARTYNLRANYLLESGRLAEAASLAQQSLNIAIDNKVTRELLFAQVTLAKIALEQQDYAKVIALGSAGIAAGNSIQQEGLQQDMRKLMIVAYRKLGDLERAFVLMDDFEKCRDTLQVRDRAQFTEELEAKFLNIQQQREIDFLNKEKQLDDERIRWLTIFMLLMLLAVIWIATLLRKQNQNNKTIQTKKEELEKYIAYNLQLENFAYIASHDLKTPLRTIVSFSQLLRRSAREKLSADEEEYLRF